MGFLVFSCNSIVGRLRARENNKAESHWFNSLIKGEKWIRSTN